VSPEGERLQKVLARAGLGSRRAIEALIAEGRVAVNGDVAELGRRVDPDNDLVEVDGSTVPLSVGLVHLLLNKPAGVVTTAHDPHGRPTVYDFVDRRERVWPVGRLDRETSGALLLTNDGPLTQRLTHPRFEVPKT
jgi:23S rRNA pseudouridine2605 synthase